MPPAMAPAAREAPSLVHLAVFDTDSRAEFMLSPGQNARVPLRCLEGDRLRLENIHPTQVLVDGIWTIAFDIPGDEAARIDALVTEYEGVFLVWNGRVLTSWNAGDITPIQKRYCISMYMIHRGFSDEATAVMVAKQLQAAHSGGARAATQLGAGAVAPQAARGSAP